jgi:hypothetical protein
LAFSSTLPAKTFPMVLTQANDFESGIVLGRSQDSL